MYMYLVSRTRVVKMYDSWLDIPVLGHIKIIVNINVIFAVISL